MNKALFLIKIGSSIAVAFLAAQASETHQLSGVSAGLCVHVGAGDGALTAELHNGGTMLVHGLVTDNASLTEARNTLQDKGLYGLVAVDRVKSYSPLPYADNLVNLLVADLDALGASAPALEEVLRVLAPGTGVAWVKEGGAWKKLTRAMPSGYGDWTHYDNGPEMNPVSEDDMSSVPTDMQWINNKIDGPRMGGSESMYRIAGGRAFTELKYLPDGQTKWKSELVVRDAFSGVTLWRKPFDRQVGRGRPLVATGSRVFVTMAWGKPLVALDAATGTEVVSYDAAGVWTSDGPTQKGTGFPMWIALADERVLVVANRESVVALDPGTGAVKWRHTEDAGVYFANTAVSTKENRVFVTYGPNIPHIARSPMVRVTGVLCLDLTTGEPVWRHTDSHIENHFITSLIYESGLLGVYHGPEFDDVKVLEGAFYLGCIETASGKLLWDHDKCWINETSGKGCDNTRGTSIRALWLRDGTFYMANGTYSFWDIDARTGTLNRFIGNFGSANGSRCARSVATRNLMLVGSIQYIARDYTSLLQEITRGGNCATAPTPAYGLLYTGPVGCKCFAMTGGCSALSSEPVGTPVSDAVRLDTSYPGGTPRSPALSLPGGSPVVFEWTDNDIAPADTTPSVESGGMRFQARCHEQRIVAGSANSTAWTFTAGGRISSTPAVADGRVMFGAHDGYVYSLNANDGSLAWRLMAAPVERRIVAYGQIESSWPVYGVVLHGGWLYASAGRHPELGGGIYLYQLDPATGAKKWSTVVRVDRKWLPVKATRPPTNRCINAVPSVEAGVLKIPGFTLDLGTGAMTLNGAAYEPSDYTPPEPVRATPGRTDAACAIGLGPGWFSLGATAHATVTLHDAAGRIVARLFSGRVSGGTTRHALPTDGLAGGRYVLRLRGEGLETARVLLVAGR